MDKLTPPFTITPNIIRLVADISEHIGRLSLASNQAAALRLNRINRIRTIQGTQKTDSAVFIEFMLRMILEAITSSVADGNTPHVTPQATPQVEQLLNVLKGDMTRDDLLVALGLSDRKYFRETYLQPALASGLVSMTNPDSPKSPKQSYRITSLGLALLKRKK